MTTFSAWRTVGVLWAGRAAVVAAVVVLPAVAWAGTTWDGGVIDTDFTTGANWDDNSAPTFTGGTSTLSFGIGGSTATVNTAADLARIILDRDASFTIANGSGSLTFQGEDVGGVLTGITASPTTVGTTAAYTISESIALGASQSWNVANNGAGGTSLSVSGVISGAGVGLTKISSGTLALTGANTFSGPLTVAEGVLSINSWNSANTNGPLGNNAANVVLGSATSAGTLRYTGGNSIPNALLRGIELAAGGGVIQMGGTGRDDGYVHLNGSSISGSGPLTINSPGMTRFIIVGSSTFSGPVAVQAGELQGSVLGSGTFTPFGVGTNGLGSAVTVDAGAILTTYSNFGTPTVLLGSLAGSGTVRTETSGSQLQIGGDDTSTTFSGQLQGTFAPVKVGSGTLALTGANTFSGPLTVAEGVLSINSWN
ncbi:MAG: autotransporter-associated beta strand repeat-containing protein, partial [Planctomycetes bacterium]|nr:autotransporter-associated beta strand repeat-containing protein [Planctomycetota bacterium]